MILTRMKIGHTRVSDIEASSLTLSIWKKEPGKPLKHAKNAYVVLLEVACTLSNSLNVQQF